MSQASWGRYADAAPESALDSSPVLLRGRTAEHNKMLYFSYSFILSGLLL